MNKTLFAGLGAGALALGGWLYYIHPAKVPPAPKNLTQVFPKALLEKANAAQLSVLRGEATSAPKTAATAANRPAATAEEQEKAAALTPAGLKVALATDKHGALIGQATNTTGQPLVYNLPAATLFTNGAGDVALLHDVSVEVPANSAADLRLPVAQTTTGVGVLEGSFTPAAGGAPAALQPLFELLSHKKNVAPDVAQTAVLIVNDDVPLDVVASFPRLRPQALTQTGPQPFRVSPNDLIAALALVREAGADPAGSAMMSEPQLKVMTMLNPESHEAARRFFGLSEQTEWDFWKRQLLEGDPALRHYAFYGIARYYPEVALQMLPRWVREPGVYRNYRISAAWALALIDDPRAQEELRGLRRELQKDPGMRQAIDRALQHLGSDSQKSQVSAR